MAIVRTRADLSVLLARQMSASVRASSGDEDIEGRAALKTYLLEAHGPVLTDLRSHLASALATQGIAVEATDEPELVALVAGEQVSWLDATPGRPWRLHVAASVKDADRVHELLTTATPFLTPLRLLPSRLESLALATGSPLVLFSLKHDRRPLRGGSEGADKRDGIDVVTLRFWAATAAKTLAALREKDVLPGATSVSSVQLRVGEDESYARVEVYHDGKCTAVGNSFAQYEKLLDAIFAEYEALRSLVDAIAQKGRRVFVPVPWRADAIEPAAARMFVGADPFALWGLPERVGDHTFRARVVDLDTARTAVVELSRDGLAIELAPGTPACVALRFLSNVQFHVHADFSLDPLLQIRAGGVPAKPEPPFEERDALDRVAAAILAETVAQWLRGAATVSVSSLLDGMLGEGRATQGHADLVRKVLSEAAAYEWSDWLKPARDDAGSTMWKFRVEPQRERTARTRQLGRLYKHAAQLAQRLAGGNVEPWSQLSLFDAEALVPPEG
ncbi:MAG: hypothetical protein JNK05_22040 [Myxococcales bacterium]|nr:hypothetical protein [Myxococcales bacterium]